MILLAVSFGYQLYGPYLGIWAIFGRTGEFYTYCLLLTIMIGVALKSVSRILKEKPVYRMLDILIILVCSLLILTVCETMHEKRHSLRLIPVESQEGETLYQRRRSDLFGNVCSVYYQKTGIIFYEYLYDK